MIKRFFECLIPVTACNLKCSYCYIIQRNHRSMNIPKLKYSIEQMQKALSKDRLGWECYFSICGAGETLMADKIIDIIRMLLENGRYVNITTNGTLNKQFTDICSLDKKLLQRLHVSFSFHYLELKRINKLNCFFENVLKAKEAGISILVQLNLSDEYLPYIDEIIGICREKVGAEPQLAATRREYNLRDNIEFLTELSEEEYKEAGKVFDSPLFDFTLKNFNVKRKEFCYAGDWSATINLQTGIMTKCYCDRHGVNIFETPEKKIKFKAIGRCDSLFCMNSSHFMALGVIPEKYKDITYTSLRNREEAGWYNETMKEALAIKLCQTNKCYSYLKRQLIIAERFFENKTYEILKSLRKCIKDLLIKG